MVLKASTILISSPRWISLSLSQQKSTLAIGPESRLDPRLGSLAGSGKDARCVGGGEPEAADIVEEGLEGGFWDGEWGLEGAGEGEGEVVNGLGGGSSMVDGDDIDYKGVCKSEVRCNG